MKTIKTICLVLFMLALPAVSFGWALGDRLVPCDNTAADPCNFNALMLMVNNVITFALKFMAVPIAAIMFAYAGFLMVTAPGGETKTRAKNIFFNTVLGLVFALAAWLIIKLILTTLGWEGGWIGF